LTHERSRSGELRVISHGRLDGAVVETNGVSVLGRHANHTSYAIEGHESDWLRWTLEICSDQFVSDWTTIQTLIGSLNVNSVTVGPSEIIEID